MEVTEEMIFTFAARFMNMRWAGEVIYNTDYEAHDTNYRMAVMTKAKELVPGNSIIENLIAKEVIAMLAPADSIEEYEQAFIDSIQDPAVKTLMTQENQKVLTRDLGTEIPGHEMYEEDEEEVENGDDTVENDMEDGYSGDGTSDTVLGGPGTPIVPVGPSYYPQQAVAVQLVGINSGR